MIPLFGGGAADMERMMQQYGAVGTLFAIVHRISTSVAAVDWHLYRKSTDRRRRYGPVEDNRTEVVSHAALDLWNQPNPYYTRQELVESTQQHNDLTGEGWWVIGRSANGSDLMRSIPLSLWCVRPDRMTPVPHPTEFLSGYVYTSPNGVKVPLELDEVIQIRMPNPLDPYRGLGPVQSILTDLDATRYSAEWNRAFFVNSAEPGGIIEVPTTLSDTEFETLRTRWNEQHKGIARAHRVAILEQGKWVDRKLTQRDMQFTQLREVSRDVIREAFGFPKAMLGVSDDVNRAVAEAQEVVFARWLVVPRLERIKGALNNDLLPLFGDTATGLEFDYDNPVPEDKVAETDDLVKRVTLVLDMLQRGVDPAAAWELVGLPQLDMALPPPPLPGSSSDSPPHIPPPEGEGGSPRGVF
jgi:HK97 family phage portal protein